MLGTLITEWEQGATYCRQLFGSPAAAEQTACQLAAIAWAYGFDGWVVNIENELLPAHVPHVIHCLRWFSSGAGCAALALLQLVRRTLQRVHGTSKVGRCSAGC